MSKKTLPNLQLPSEEEFAGWKAHPVTEAFFALVDGWREELKERWANRGFLSEKPHITHGYQCENAGRLEIIDMLRELDHKQFISEFNND